MKGREFFDESGKWIIDDEGFSCLVQPSGKWYRDQKSKLSKEVQPEEPEIPPSQDQEIAELHYMLMLESARNDSHDQDISDIYFTMMVGGYNA